MAIHTVSSYEENLNLLTTLVCEMGNLLSDLLQFLHIALKNNNQVDFEDANNIDKKINELDIEIEDRAVSLIALRQPMSIDLRHIISSLKSAVIIERMGDLAKNTVKRASKISEFNKKTIQEDLNLILDILKKMLSEALQAYQKLDEKLALKVCIDDQKIDDLYKKILLNLQHKLTENQNDVESILQAIFAVKNIERIGDYISKIAQMIPYIVKGKKVSKKEIKLFSGKDFA